MNIKLLLLIMLMLTGAMKYMTMNDTDIWVME